MKLWLKFLSGSVLAMLTAIAASGQQSPILTVSFTHVYATMPGDPANENSGPVGTTINIEALAVGTFPAGRFTYTFFVNGATLGSPSPEPANGTPAVVSWTPPQPGVYFFTVTANDGSNTATALPVRFFATGTEVNSPVTNTVVPLGSSISLKADATPAAAGFIQKIEFYANNVKIGEDSTYPYSIIYTPVATPVTTPATARYGNAATATATLSISNIVVTASGSGYVAAPNVFFSGGGGVGAAAHAVLAGPGGAPVASILIDAVGTGYTSAPTITIVPVAADPGTGATATATCSVTGLVLTYGGTGYAAGATPTVTLNGGGGFGATATATTAAGAVNTITPTATGAGYTSSPTVTIAGPPFGPLVNNFIVTNGGVGYAAIPTVSVVGGGAVSPSFGTATATIGGGAVTGITLTTPGSGYTSTPAVVVSPTIAITAIATDNNNVRLPESVPILITVVTPIGTPPTSAISTPANNAAILIPTGGASIPITVDARSPDGFITKVELYIDGVLFKSTVSYPYTFAWTPTVLGTYHLVALAFDDKNNVVASSTTIAQIGAAPAVSLTTPASGAAIVMTVPPAAPTTQLLTATVTALTPGSTITSVTFYADGTLLPSTAGNPNPVTTAPYTYTWTPTSSGRPQLTAVATDSDGFSTTSTPVLVTIAGGFGGGGGSGAPVLSATGISATPASAFPGDTVTFTVVASNSGGSSPADDFGASGVADFDITLTNITTNYTFVVHSATLNPLGVHPVTVIPGSTPGGPGVQPTPGTGSFNVTVPIPTKVTQAGPYRATVQMLRVSTGTIGSGTFSNSSAVLTITGKPDFQITSLTYPAGTSYFGGDPIPMTLTFTNNVKTNGTQNVPYVPGVGGMPAFIRIQVVLSSNPTFGDADDQQLTFFDVNLNLLSTMAGNGGATIMNADGTDRTITWTQILPGNFAGSYYVLAKINALPGAGALAENDPPAQTVNGDNVWAGNSVNPSATLINLLPSNFPATVLGSHASGVATSANGYSDNPSMSADGRYVAFVSDATNLVANDTNNARDVFLFDSQTNTIRLLSKSQQGVQGNGAANNPALSGNGRWVAFSWEATNLNLFGDTNGFADIYAVDTVTGLINRVSVTSSGDQANNPSFRPAISQDGRYVVFESTATNLVPGVVRAIVVNNGGAGYVTPPTVTLSGGGATATATALANIAGGAVTSITITNGGVGYNGTPVTVTITGGGTTTPATAAAAVTPSMVVTPGLSHIFLRNRAVVPVTDTAGNLIMDTPGNTETTLVDVTPAGVPGNGTSHQPAISTTGNYVAFASTANNLVAAPITTVGRQHVYARPVAYTGGSSAGAAVLGTTKLISVVNGTGAEGNANSQTPTLNSDGHWVAFASLASNLVAGDTNGVSDVFVYDTTAAVATPVVRRVSLPDPSTGFVEGVDPMAPGFQLGSVNPTISADGRYVAFASLDDNLTSGDANGQAQATDSNNALDIFVHDRDASASGTFDTGTVTTTMASRNKFGYQTNGLLGIPSSASSNIYPAISADGRFVAFPSDAENNAGLAFGATNLLPQDSNGFRDVFVYDRRTNSVSSGGGNNPSVTITGPGNGSSVLVNVATTLSASAVSVVGVVANVQFYVNATAQGGPITVFPYTTTWTPTTVGSYSLSAIVTDSFGNQGISAVNTVAVNAAPSVSITNPADGSVVTANTTQTVTANSSATTPGATITSVQFFANNISLGTVTALPYQVSWTPGAPGTYALTALAIDSNGNRITSAVVNVNADQAPTVTITSPIGGSSIGINSTQTITATATPGNFIKQVDFFANGSLLGTSTTAPYSFVWKPTSGGIYNLTAVATNNLGTTTSSAAVVVLVVGGGVGATDAVYTGSYQGLSETGHFALINLHGVSGTFIGYSTGTPAKTYYYADLTVDAGGGFTLLDGSGHTIIRGSISDSGVNGSFTSGTSTDTFIGPITLTGSSPVASGYYTGNISGDYASTLAAIVGPDGSITIYVTDGSFHDAGSGYLATTGSFSVTTTTGTRVVGKIDPTTGFLSGTISGGATGSILAANGSGATFSDGVLKSLSTRGQAGTGDNMLIAGFIISGTTAKKVLIRAVGPTLAAAPYNVSGALVDPQFSVIPLGGSVAIAGNDNWGGTAALQTAFAQVYAFGLPLASKDAAAIVTLPPGGYTVQVSSVTGATGVALVELYDMDTLNPFTAQKLTGVSTRGLVGAGDNVLIAGVLVSGNMPKKVLVRAIGPTLAGFGVSNALADPILTIKSGNTTVRENDNWETGNDPALIAEASLKLGINALASGSKDAVILMTLPPGLYSAVVSSANGATGVALVEVYEVP